MRASHFIIIFLIVAGSWFGCTFENEREYFGLAATCDTTDITYDSLTYVFQGTCLGCHSEKSSFRPGIAFDDYASTKASINTGKVLPAIKHTGDYKMPYNLPQLPECDIKKIETWINNGMPE